jgi:hypothetical protein
VVIIRKDVSIEENLWHKIIGNDLAMLDTSPERAQEIKEELMPMLLEKMELKKVV